MINIILIIIIGLITLSPTIFVLYIIIKHIFRERKYKKQKQKRNDRENNLQTFI